MSVTATRGSIPTVSATLAANETMEARRRAGLPALPLAFGEAGLPVHPDLTRALCRAAGDGRYGPVSGSRELCEAAAGYWQRRGVIADPELVVAGPGSKPLLYALLMAIGGDVVVPQPSWVSYAAQARLIGSRPIPVPPPSSEGGVPDPERLVEEITFARAAGRDVRAMIFTMPDNPTGRLARPETVRRLCEIARELDLVIIADQIYRDLVFDPSVDFPCPTRYAPERTVITTALSKMLAVGGWRLGVTVLPDGPIGHELHGRVAGVASEVWSSPSAPVQPAAAYAFSEPPELVERVDASRALHARVARAMADRFTAAGARVAPPQGGFYIYPDFEDQREHLASEYEIRTSDDLAQKLLRDYGVGVLPGSVFGDSPQALRLRVATSLLYGETDEQRNIALTSTNPAGLPWIAAALDRTSEVLGDLTGAVRERRKLAVTV